MIYTQRRATSPRPDVTGVHGSDLGIASSPDGHNWLYRGTIAGLEFEPGRNTWWAPEIIYHNGIYHMYVSYVKGMPVNWNRPRSIIHYTASDLWKWKLEDILDLGAERVIDACVAKIPSGLWRMWYKNESDNSNSYYADSDDLYNWTPKGKALSFDPHEGANVFSLSGRWWYICDLWRGQGVFRSDDCAAWEYCGLILDKPGKREGDNAIGNHADVVAQGEEAFIFYFTHPQRDANNKPAPFTSIQVARITTDGTALFCNRDEDFDFNLQRL